MNDIVISARGLGKKYLIGHQVDRNVTLREQIMAGAGAMKRNLTRTLRGEQILAGDEIEEFWALNGVDFDIRRGDVVGVIGRNGAGKSTLLKILSRITEPTTGRVEIRGRVASLLEVGTGFHPELTGRENIFLNGAILGMSREEIRRKFDEIVDFAGVEKFLDTPVKRYSSGMYVRLAFSVAAHLDPEILIVDEVLAVGDAEFQNKCLGKMKDVAGSGKTVLFVSHNLAAISRLCGRGLHLVSGKVKCDDFIEPALNSYRESSDLAQSMSAEFSKAGADPYISGIELQSGTSTSPYLLFGEPFRMAFSVANASPGLRLRVGVLSVMGEKIADFDSSAASIRLAGKTAIDCEAALLMPGQYNLNVSLYSGNRIVDRAAPAIRFRVADGEYKGKAVYENRNDRSLVYVPHVWKSA